jgi:hypothetical protein
MNEERTMSSILEIERERNIKLPEAYKDFYDDCFYSIPPKLIGTDLLNDRPLLNGWATELLEEDRVENFLAPDDFAFMMHQGYMFWHFKADGNEYPVVYEYYEGRLKPDNLGLFSKFVKGFYS